MRNIRVILIAASLVLFCGNAYSKTQICTITMNSKDEINVFKKYYSSDEYEFIELTDLAQSHREASDSNDRLWYSTGWIDKACEQNIRCDVLLISSHQWEGRFFGESKENPFRLTHDHLRKYRCENRCGSVLGNLKQVFLFGCNTLTNQDGDYTNFENYIDYLAYDGHSEKKSQFIPAAHTTFSRAQFSNKNSMKMIFSDVPQIYGFQRRSPLGFQVAPFVNKFFTGKSQEQLTNFISNKDEQLKKDFAKVLFSQNLILEKGANLEKGTGTSRQQLYCDLNYKSDFFDKLIVIKDLIKKERNLQQNRMILQTIWPKNKNQMQGFEIDNVEFFRNDDEAKAIFDQEFEKNVSLGGKLDIVYIGAYFGVYNLNQALDLQRKAIGKFFHPKMTSLDRNILCEVMTYQKNIYLSDDDIFPSWLVNKTQKEAATCIKAVQAKPGREINSVKPKKK